eukprot:5860164-Amphidinium_carterae.1
MVLCHSLPLACPRTNLHVDGYTNPRSELFGAYVSRGLGAQLGPVPIHSDHRNAHDRNSATQG